MLKILALDLGGHLGVCHNLFENGEDVHTYTVHLAKSGEIAAWGLNRMTRRCDPRIERFANLLRALPKPDLVVWEDVQFSTYTLQTQLWSSYRTVVWMTLGPTCCLDCVPVTTLKQFATGNGGAKKPQMLAALQRKFPEIPVVGLDDNAIDSVWIWLWAKQNLGRLVRHK